LKLTELKNKGRVILKSIGFPSIYSISKRKLIESSDESKDPFKVIYACDSGSTNPLLFDCGLFVDICHCAIASTPSDLDLHRKRTIVCSGFSSKSDSSFLKESTWNVFDEGFCRSKTISIDSSLLKKRIARMVHDVALYYSESEHMLFIQNEFKKDGFLIMDGPLYPKQLMYWMSVPSDDILIRHDKTAQKILQNYVDIIDFHIKTQIPVVGFVKNPEDVQIVNALNEMFKEDGIYKKVPWSSDSQMFKAFLKSDDFKGEHVNSKKPNVSINSKKSNTRANSKYKTALNKSDELSYTNWFIQPNQYYEKEIKSSSPLVYGKLNHENEPEDYALSFFIVHTVIDGKSIIFKIECPYGLIKSEDMRQKITGKMLFELSLYSIPETLSKADSIAKISVLEKNTVQSMFKVLNIDTNYNLIRWGDLDEYWE